MRVADIAFLHYNALPHTTNRTQLKILDLDLKNIDYLPYSPDLSPTDYYFIWNLDNFLQEKLFNIKYQLNISRFHRFTLFRLLCKRHKWITIEIATVYCRLRSILWIIEMLFYSNNNQAPSKHLMQSLRKKRVT